MPVLRACWQPRARRLGVEPYGRGQHPSPGALGVCAGAYDTRTRSTCFFLSIACSRNPQFSTGHVNTTAELYPVEWPVRAVAAAVYNAQASRRAMWARGATSRTNPIRPHRLRSTHFGTATTAQHGRTMSSSSTPSLQTPRQLTALAQEVCFRRLMFGLLPISMRRFRPIPRAVLRWVPALPTTATLPCFLGQRPALSAPSRLRPECVACVRPDCRRWTYRWDTSQSRSRRTCFFGRPCNCRCRAGLGQLSTLSTRPSR